MYQARSYREKFVDFEPTGELLGDGAEGKVYRIAKPRRWKATRVFKLYKSLEGLSAVDKEKIKVLVGSGWGSKRLLFPEYWVTREGEFIGFLMRMGKGQDLETYLANRKWSMGLHLENESLRLCAEVAGLVDEIHSKGDIVIGDLKPQNILVSDRLECQLIDLDAIQFRLGNHDFPASAVTPEYAAPDYLKAVKLGGRTRLHQYYDRFSLAVILYKILFQIHPFVGGKFDDITKSGDTLADYIVDGRFPYGLHAARCRRAAPKHKAFEDSAPKVQEFFVRCFREGHYDPSLRPLAAEWRDLFQKAAKGRLGTGVVPAIDLRADNIKRLQAGPLNLEAPIQQFRLEEVDGYYAVISYRIKEGYEGDIRFRGAWFRLARNLRNSGVIRVPFVRRTVMLVVDSVHDRKATRSTIFLEGAPSIKLFSARRLFSQSRVVQFDAEVASGFYPPQKLDFQPSDSAVDEITYSQIRTTKLFEPQKLKIK
ncbi:MAG: hypothetical protein AAF998_23035 [Bacteroidota bacterium]